MIHLSISFIIMALGLFMHNTTVLAQQDDLGGMGGLGEEMSLFQEIPSVFGASKYEQKVTDAPASISIVTADEIKKYGYRTLGDILNSLRGFYITDDHNYTYIGARGFGRPGDYNTRLLLLIDGHRENDSIYSASSSERSSTIDVDLIDRVEVIRGPSSSIYGTGAFFGVINVITKRGRDYQTVETSAEAGTNETYNGRLTYGNKYDNGLELLISGNHFDSDGEDWYYPEPEFATVNNGVADGRDWERDTNFFLKAGFGDFTLTGAYSERKDGYPTAAWGTVFNDPNSEVVDEKGYLDLKHQATLGDNWGVLTRLFYDFYNYDGTYPYEFPPDPYYIFKDEAKDRGWGAEVQANKNFNAHNIIIGFDYRNNSKQDQAAWDDTGWEYLNDKRDSEVWAVYLQDEFKIFDKLTLNAGVRYDKYDTFGDSTNPRVAIIYNPVEKTNIKVLYGTAFRAPNAYELYYHDGGDYQYPNPYLQPETIDTYELTLEQYVGDKYRIIATGFYYEIEDLITNSDHPTDLNLDGDPITWFQNVEKVKAQGAEIELEGKFGNGIKGNISYTFQDTEDDATGQTLSNSPENMVKLNITAPFFNERLFVGLEELYMDKRLSVNNNTIEDFFVTNLTLFSNSLAEGMELSLSIYNLFDENYSDPGSLEHTQDAIEQAGRTCRVKLTYAF